MKAILVTGGLGFIGSHTCVELASVYPNCQIVIIDDLSNSKMSVLDMMRHLVPDNTVDNIFFYHKDLREDDLDDVFVNHRIEYVIHFAGVKAVNESIKDPVKYYDNNIGSTTRLLKYMKKYGVKNIVFSSSATVYNDNKTINNPYSERDPLGSTHPYGQTKIMIERILGDLFKSRLDMKIIILRYFNPVGCHKSGLLGEDPNDIPNNIMPYIVRVFRGEQEKLIINGNDYPTKDGTCVRDFIHVVDLAEGHIAALNRMMKCETGLFKTYNLGTGVGVSVLELVNMFNEVSNGSIKWEYGERRGGDSAVSFSDPSLAKKELGWETSRSLRDICESTYRFCCHV